MIDDEALVNLRVVQPSDAEIVKTVTDLPRKSWTAWLAYPKEARSLPQPLLDNQTGRKLKATNPNLLAAENAGLLFPAFSPGHESVVANSVLNGLSVGAERTGVPAKT